MSNDGEDQYITPACFPKEYGQVSGFCAVSTSGADSQSVRLRRVILIVFLRHGLTANFALLMYSCMYFSILSTEVSL